MRCPGCQADINEQLESCPDCHLELRVRCGQCASFNRANAKFCNECGAQLGAAPSTSPARTPPTEPVRRQLTVMFCDLVGSTALSDQLDPEDLRDVIRTYQEMATTAVIEHGGHIGKYLGDGLLVYFGYPTANEDDARRAVRAALQVVAAMPELSAGLVDRLPGVQLPSLMVRIGIDTGLVIAGEMGAGEFREQLAIVGQTPNVAARLQEIAEPNTVVISSQTRHLVEGFFEFFDRGSHVLKGIPTPVCVYRVERETGIRSRVELGARDGLTPLVSRQREVQLLESAWMEALEGQSRVLIISGDAGIGKSRLIHALRDLVETTQHRELLCMGSALHQQSAFHPLIEYFDRLVMHSPGASLAARRAALDRELDAIRLTEPGAIDSLCCLLSLSSQAPHPDPRRQRQATMDALLAYVRSCALDQPLLMVFEDLHLYDPSTLEFIEYLTSQGAAPRSLLILSHRPSFVPALRGVADLTSIALEPLNAADSAVMISGVAGGKSLPDLLLAQLVSKTDGIPLYVEEMTKMVLESGLVKESDTKYALVGALPALAIPSSLQDALTARLDRLATVKEVAALGATLGRSFDFALIRCVSGLSEDVLRIELDRLIVAGLIARSSKPGEDRYSFKHALVQDAAYQSLTRSSRQHYHQQVAHSLEREFPEMARTQPEVLAHHFTQAGLCEPALGYWCAAGRAAAERSANKEAVTHYQSALSQVRLLAPSPKREELELELQLALGPVLMATMGLGAPEVGETYDRARELSRSLPEGPSLFAALLGPWPYYISTARHTTARSLGERSLTVAESLGDSSLLLEAHLAMGTALFFLGDPEAGHRHLLEGIALYDPDRHRHLAFEYGFDPGSSCHSRAGNTSWHLGKPKEALSHAKQGIEIARKLGHAHSLVAAIHLAGTVHHLLHQPAEAQPCFEESMSLAREHGLPFFASEGMIFRGHARAALGDLADGLREMEEGFKDRCTIGVQLLNPYFLAILAETRLTLGDFDGAAHCLEEAEETMHRTNEQLFEPEMHRIRGKIALGQSSDQSLIAEECFRMSIWSARQRKMRALELRAALDIHPLLSETGRDVEARTFLQAALSGFSEGWDMPEASRAARLLGKPPATS